MTTAPAALYQIDLERAPRRELLSWLRLNGLEPNEIPYDAPLLVAEGPDGEWCIRCTVFLRNGAGKRYLLPKSLTLAVREESAPLPFDPPMTWLESVST